MVVGLGTDVNLIVISVSVFSTSRQIVAVGLSDGLPGAERTKMATTVAVLVAVDGVDRFCLADAFIGTQNNNTVRPALAVFAKTRLASRYTATPCSSFTAARQTSFLRP